GVTSTESISPSSMEGYSTIKTAIEIPSTTESSSSTTQTNTGEVLEVTSPYFIKKIENVGGTNLFTLNVEETKDIYLVVTSHFDNQLVSASENIASSSITPVILKEIKEERDLGILKKVIDFREKAYELLKESEEKSYRVTKIAREVSQGDEEYFCVDIDMDDPNRCIDYRKATAQKVIISDTRYGEKTLVIWVEDSEYPSPINDELINNLANIFLKEGGDKSDDIYDWETNVYGEEWGDTGKSNLIEPTDIIDILVFDMGNELIAGYFWSKDNFTKEYLNSSNEKIMFYINSQLLAKDEKEAHTTLVHEFQHMIAFYQRAVLKDIMDETWFSEMLSESIEDLLAVNIEYDGPRNVSYTDGSAGEIGNSGGLSQRFVEFNKYNYVPLPTWGVFPGDYGKVSAFGAYLSRNFNGAEVLHNIFYSNKSGKDAILEATKLSDFNDLLARWATAVILSDKTDAPDGLRYNFGDFKEVEYNGITYKLGSINFFNYVVPPTMLDEKVMYKDANFYHEVGKGVSGRVDVKVEIGGGGDITIIAK
ncbi:MAG: hypothetical protein GXO02_06005, partial [Epsilonproteobacteria bacterium]|nr:hypothetical protein [Campylobacterota bacterium]